MILAMRYCLELVFQANWVMSPTILQKESFVSLAKFYSWEKTNAPTTFKIRTVNAVHIPPYSEVAVLTEVQDTEKDELSMTKGHMPNILKPLLIGRALSKSKEKRMPTPTINTGGETLKLQVNTVNEEASEVDEDGILMTNISEPKHDLGKTLDQSKT